MIWHLDPIATWVWVVASSATGLAYTTVLSHMLSRMVGASELWQRRMARFINFCGAGHVLMMLFMTLAHDNPLVWRMVVTWDVLTALVSVEFAAQVWRENRKK